MQLPWDSILWSRSGKLKKPSRGTGTADPRAHHEAVRTVDRGVWVPRALPEEPCGVHLRPFSRPSEEGGLRAGSCSRWRVFSRGVLTSWHFQGCAGFGTHEARCLCPEDATSGSGRLPGQRRLRSGCICEQLAEKGGLGGGRR